MEQLFTFFLRPTAEWSKGKTRSVCRASNTIKLLWVAVSPTTWFALLLAFSSWFEHFRLKPLEPHSVMTINCMMKAALTKNRSSLGFLYFGPKKQSKQFKAATFVNEKSEEKQNWFNYLKFFSFLGAHCMLIHVTSITKFWGRLWAFVWSVRRIWEPTRFHLLLFCFSWLCDSRDSSRSDGESQWNFCFNDSQRVHCNLTSKIPTTKKVSGWLCRHQ